VTRPAAPAASFRGTTPRLAAVPTVEVVRAFRDAVAWVQRHPHLADAALAAVLTALVLPGLWLYDQEDFRGQLPRPPDGWGALVTCLAVAPIALRRRWPLPVLAAVLAGEFLLSWFDYAQSAGGLGVLVALYSVGALARRPHAWWAFGGSLAALVGILLREPGNLTADALLGNGLILATAFLLGDNVRTRRAYTAALEQRAERAERERDEQARQAAADERRRIARELHDIIAHSLSVMVVQAAAARRTADPDQATAAVRQVEDTGRQALAEMRRLLGVLAEVPGCADPGGLAPQPGLGNVDDLVDKLRQAGLDLEVSIEGQPRPLSAGVDLSAFRIVQEALTNCLKHAGPARVRVVLRYDDAELCVQVLDDGRGAAACLQQPGPVPGHGLVGMRERVALFRGNLRAGPRRDGGFEVLARLPLEPGPVASRPVSSSRPAPAPAASAPTGR
jgi:signal transduction histidine kinase